MQELTWSDHLINTNSAHACMIFIDISFVVVLQIVSIHKEWLPIKQIFPINAKYRIHPFLYPTIIIN